MKTINRGWTGVLDFFLISPRERIFSEIKDFFNDITPGFLRQFCYEFVCFSFNDKIEHALPIPGALIAFHDLFRVKRYKIAGPVDLGNHLPVPIIPLTLYHAVKQVIITLSGFF